MTDLYRLTYRVDLGLKWSGPRAMVVQALDSSDACHKVRDASGRAVVFVRISMRCRGWTKRHPAAGMGGLRCHNWTTNPGGMCHLHERGA